MWHRILRVLPIFGLIATAAAAILGIATSFWLTERISQLAAQTPTAAAGYFEVAWANALNFKAPLFYFLGSVVVSLGTSIEGVVNRYRYGEHGKVQALLRSEMQEHGETKRSYYDTLTTGLKNLLASPSVGFDETCRVTVYRMQSDNDRVFKRVFRYSKNHKFRHEGRVKVPIDEGFVGVAWGNHGETEFLSTEKFGSAEFDAAILGTLQKAQCANPPSDLSMPSTHFYAKAVEDPTHGRRAGIVVYESTDLEKLNAKEIRDLMTNETLAVSRYVLHLGILDSEFNPDSGGEDGDG